MRAHEAQYAGNDRFEELDKLGNAAQRGSVLFDKGVNVAHVILRVDALFGFYHAFTLLRALASHLDGRRARNPL